MRVETKNEPSFVDSFVSIPTSELDVLEELIDWRRVSQKLRKVKTDYRPLSLFKMLLLQTWYNMSDQTVSNAVTRDLVYMRFCGFSIEGAKPDATTLCRFRNKLVKRKLIDKVLLIVNNSLESRGLKLSSGKYISADATLIQSTRRARKTLVGESREDGTYETGEIEYSDDKEAGWMKKGARVSYGYSTTVMTDEDGLVITAITHFANKSEMTRFGRDVKASNLRPGQRLLYDKGAASQENRELLRSEKLIDGIMIKKPRGRELSYWQKLRNRLISSKRFVTERTFGTMKRVYGMSRARYLGIAKVQAEVLLKSISYNLKRAINMYIRQDSCAQN